MNNKCPKCGFEYGEFDLERILRTIRVVNDQLVVKQSGIYAVENYLMAMLPINICHSLCHKQHT